MASSRRVSVAASGVEMTWYVSAVTCPSAPGSRLPTAAGSGVNIPSLSSHWPWIVVVGAKTTAGRPNRPISSSPMIVLPDPGGATR